MLFLTVFGGIPVRPDSGTIFSASAKGLPADVEPAYILQRLLTGYLLHHQFL